MSIKELEVAAGTVYHLIDKDGFPRCGAEMIPARAVRAPDHTAKNPKITRYPGTGLTDDPSQVTCDNENCKDPSLAIRAEIEKLQKMLD